MLEQQRFRVIAAAAGVGLLAACLGVGIVVGKAIGGGNARAPEATGAAPSSTRGSSTPSASPAATASPTAMPGPSPSPIATPEPPSLTETPPQPTPTMGPPVEPRITVLNVQPVVGTEVDVAAIDVSIDVDYQAGPVSNVLGWTLYYCFGPIDCNTYSLPAAYDIVPGARGSASLRGVFSPGANHLHPAILCQVTVVMGHFVTPETQWQSALSQNPRCHPDAANPRLKVTDVQPPLGSVLQSGSVVTVNVEYDAGPATQIRVGYLVDQCGGDLFAFAAAGIAPGTSGVKTLLINVTAQSAGKPLHHIDADLRQNDVRIATYSFGPC